VKSQTDVTDPASVSAVGVKADDMVYNLSAKMLSPIQVRAKRHDFLLSCQLHGTENIIAAMAGPVRQSWCISPPT
jgi:dTDP-glucose 4,6-dehydratase